MSSSSLNFVSSSIIFFSPFFLIMQVSSSSSNHPIIMNLSSLFVTMSPYHHIAIMILHQVLSPSSYFPPLSLPQIVIPPRPFSPGPRPHGSRAHPYVQMRWMWSNIRSTRQSHIPHPGRSSQNQGISMSDLWSGFRRHSAFGAARQDSTRRRFHFQMPTLLRKIYQACKLCFTLLRFALPLTHCLIWSERFFTFTNNSQCLSSCADKKEPWS